MNNNDIYMQMKEYENYIHWNPDNLAYGSANYVEIHEDNESIKFVICCDRRTIELLFVGIVPVYMRSEEGIRMLSWSIVQEKNKDKAYFQKWPIYKVENSCLIKWALTESCGLYSDNSLTHYCIVTDQEIIDILSMCEPIIVATHFD